ncbi:MAG: hypothetical protein IPJ43_15025 [Saprospiraceae bacterium]|nr:hypothetical protein [Saprospiraceae bacterium]
MPRNAPVCRYDDCEPDKQNGYQPLQQEIVERTPIYQKDWIAVDARKKCSLIWHLYGMQLMWKNLFQNAIWKGKVISALLNQLTDIR